MIPCGYELLCTPAVFCCELFTVHMSTYIHGIMHACSHIYTCWYHNVRLYFMLLLKGTSASVFGDYSMPPSSSSIFRTLLELQEPVSGMGVCTFVHECCTAHNLMLTCHLFRYCRLGDCSHSDLPSCIGLRHCDNSTVVVVRASWL